jgi:hypothetical protein
LSHVSAGEDLDPAVHAHLARMPAATRALLEPLVADDAADAWLRDALLAYLRYFVRVFEREVQREPAESALADELARLTDVARTADADADITEAEARLAPRFADRGYRFLGGRTPPYLGAYIWTRTEDRSYTVALPRADSQTVNVHFLHEFLIRGWLHWRTFGEQGAGGWYKQDDPDWPDGLYCVAEKYPDPDASAVFRVSLLGHEAQHVADHQSFPGLSSTELEYRAKLVELIQYTSAEDRLRFFLADAADDPEQPHPYAALLIVNRLADRLFDVRPSEEKWASIPYARIAAEAEALLDEDTARLTASRPERPAR